MKSRSGQSRIILRLVFALFLTALLQGYVNAQSLLWRISRNDLSGFSYLYGTIHLTNSSVFEWKDSIYAKIGTCNVFAGELELSQQNMMKAAGMMMLPQGQSLYDHFSPDEYALIETAVKSCSGFDLKMFNSIKPPALIALCFAEKKSGDLEATVDELLYQYARSNNIETVGLETVEEQMNLLNKIPDEYVLEYFSNLELQDIEFDKLLHCYRKADLDSLWILLQEAESGTLLNEELIRIRNYRMTERIIPLVSKQNTFIAIGCGHLPGAEGVIELLRKEGFKVDPCLKEIW